MGFPFCPLAKCPQDSQEEQQQTAGCQTTGRIAVHIAGVPRQVATTVSKVKEG